MKRFGQIAAIAVLTSAIAASGAYAMAPEAVTNFFMACCDAVCACCPK